MPIDELQDIRFAMKDTIYQKTLDKLEKECNELTSLKKILKKSLEVVATAIHAEASSIWIFNAKRTHLTPTITYGGARLVGLEVDAKKSICGKVATSKKSILVDNVKDNKNWSSKIDQKSGYRTETMICVPAVFDKISYGAIQFVNRTDAEAYDEKDLSFVQGIVNYVFMRISNNKEFIAHLVTSNSVYAARKREQIVDNFLDLLSAVDKEAFYELIDNLELTKYLGPIDDVRFSSCMKTIYNISRKCDN